MVGIGGKKNKTMPGVYFELSPRDVKLYSGIFQLEKEQLYNIRQEIAYNMDEFANLVSDKKFIETFEEIRGDKNKRLDKDLMELTTEQPLLLNKNFYYFKRWKTQTIFDNKLDDLFIETYKVALPLNDFFHRALTA